MTKDSESLPGAIGTHQVRIEKDVVFVIVKNDYTIGDATAVTAEVESTLVRLGSVFVLVDLTQAGKLHPEVRRSLADWNKAHRVSGAVMFGGGAVNRAMATLLISAIRVFWPDSAPSAFTATEAEARAWIAEQRARLLAKRSPTLG